MSFFFSFSLLLLLFFFFFSFLVNMCQQHSLASDPVAIRALGTDDAPAPQQPGRAESRAVQLLPQVPVSPVPRQQLPRQRHVRGTRAVSHLWGTGGRRRRDGRRGRRRRRRWRWEWWGWGLPEQPGLACHGVAPAGRHVAAAAWRAAAGARQPSPLRQWPQSARPCRAHQLATACRQSGESD